MVAVYNALFSVTCKNLLTVLNKHTELSCIQFNKHLLYVSFFIYIPGLRGSFNTVVSKHARECELLGEVFIKAIESGTRKSILKTKTTYNFILI